MASEVIDIIIRQRGARSVQKQLGDIGGRAGQAEASLRSLKGVLGALAGGTVVRQLAATADQFTLLGNRARVFATSGKDAQDRVKGIIDVATKARAPLDATATIFQRLSLVQKEAGISTKELLGITETLTKAIAVSGATAQEAEGALRQLAQGIAANRLSGQEFNSVIEQTPRIAQAISDSIGIEIGALRKLANEGKITREVIIESFRAQAGAIAEEFEKVLPTLGQAFTNLHTSVIVFIGSLSETSGVAQFVAKSILDLSVQLLRASTNTEIWLPLLNNLLIVLGGIAAAGAAKAINSIAASILRLNANLVKLAFANPFTAIIALATLAGAAIFNLKDKVIEVGDQKFRLTELAEVLGEDLVKSANDFFSELAGFDFELPLTFKQGFNSIVQGFNIMARIAGEVLVAMFKAFDGFFSDVTDLAATFPAILTAVLKGDFELAGELTSQAWSGGFTKGLESFRDEGVVQKIINEELKKDHFDLVVAVINGSDAITEATKRTTTALIEEAAAIAAAKAAAEKGNDSDDSGDNTVSLGEDAGTLDKLKADLRSVQEELDPTLALINAANDSITVLSQAYERGLISGTEFAESQALVNEALREGIAVLDFEKLEGFAALTEGAREGFRRFGEDVTSTAEIVADAVDGALNGAIDTLIDFAANGKQSAKDFAKSMLQQIAKVILKLLILKAIQSAVGIGGGGGATNAGIGVGGSAVGLAAEGANTRAGQDFIVGEKGPELFKAPSTGRIIPNDQLGMGSAAPAVNLSVVNLDDPNAIPDALNTKAGEEAVLNIISRNPDVLREAT